MKFAGRIDIFNDIYQPHDYGEVRECNLDIKLMTGKYNSGRNKNNDVEMRVPNAKPLI